MARRLVELVLQGKDETKAAFASADSSLKGLGGSADGASKSFGGLNVSSLKMAGGLAAAGAAVVTLGKYFSDAATRAGELEAAMAEVRTLTNAMPKEQRILTNQVRDLSVKFGQLDTTMAKAAYNITSAGFGDSAEMLALLEVSAKAAIAGITDVNTAATLLTQSLNAYGAGADEAAKYSDILFATVKGGVTTFPELAANLGKVTGIAATAGITFEEVAAAIAVMTQKGINTAEATTALNALILAMVSGSEE